jgi:hypothetical protein
MSASPKTSARFMTADSFAPNAASKTPPLTAIIAASFNADSPRQAAAVDDRNARPSARIRPQSMHSYADGETTVDETIRERREHSEKANVPKVCCLSNLAWAIETSVWIP